MVCAAALGCSGTEVGREKAERQRAGRGGEGEKGRSVHPTFSCSAGSTRVTVIETDCEIAAPSATAGRPVVREIVASGPLARAVRNPKIPFIFGRAARSWLVRRPVGLAHEIRFI